MQPLAIRVRRAGFLVALLMPSAMVDAQVGIQVKNGTLWGSSTQIPSLQPLSLRWKWDSNEKVTRVVWQVATQTTTSTVATRAGDPVAKESELNLPLQSGVYQNFTVTPVSDWSTKFSIRVRVDVGAKSVYSRWVNVSVSAFDRALTTTPVTCKIEGWKRKPGQGTAWNRTTYVPAVIMPIAFNELVDASAGWTDIKVDLLFRNPSGSAASYRPQISISKDGILQNNPFYLPDGKQVWELRPAETDTFPIPDPFFEPKTTNGVDPVPGSTETHRYSFLTKVVPPVGTTSKTCTFSFSYKHKLP